MIRLLLHVNQGNNTHMESYRVSITKVIGAGYYFVRFLRQTSLDDNRVGLTSAVAARYDVRTFTFEFACLNRSSSRVFGTV